MEFVFVQTLPSPRHPRALFPRVDASPEGGEEPPELPFSLMVAVNKFDLLPSQVRWPPAFWCNTSQIAAACLTALIGSNCNPTRH